jgi:hypothetical protein
MYFRTLEGLGFDGPADVLVGTCQAWVVTVPFKNDVKDFRAELWKAIGRHVKGKTNRLQLGLIAAGTSIEGLIKNFHSSIQSQSTKLEQLNNVVPIKATLHSSNGKLSFIELTLLGGFAIQP